MGAVHFHRQWARVAVAGFALWSAPAWAAELTADEIAKKVEENFRGFIGQRVDADLVLRDPSGAERKQTLVQLTTEDAEAGGRRRNVIRFTAPAEVAGTALLTVEEPGSRDTQWIYLAHTREVKQVGETSWSAAFSGSELTFEDLTFPAASRYHHTLAGSGTVEGRACIKVQRVPRFEGSAYGRAVSCIDSERFVVLSTEFFDRADVLIKKALLSDYQTQNGKFRPGRFEMTNVQTGRSTSFVTTKVQLGVKLSPKLFTPAQLARK